MEIERTIQEDVKLNKLSLDDAAEEQASVFNYWSDLEADKRFERDTSINLLKKVIGDKTLFYWSNPKDGIKATANSIEAMVDSDSEVHHMRIVLDTLNHELNKLESAVRSMEQKAKQIDNLRHLVISGYYSVPNHPTRTDELADNTRAGLNKKN